MRPTRPLRALGRIGLTAGTLAASVVSGSAAGESVASRPVVAARRCPVVHVVGPASAPTGAARTPAKRAGNAVMSIRVTVPRLAVVRLAADATPVAVMTNTGEAPGVGDVLAVIAPGGPVVVADERGLVRRVAAGTDADWSQRGRWHPITC